jgi:hypothetical protein
MVSNMDATALEPIGQIAQFPGFRTPIEFLAIGDFHYTPAP